MPNHVHGILTLTSQDSPVEVPLVGAQPRAEQVDHEFSPTLGSVIGAFKSLTTARYAQGVELGSI
jgi:hypothetical protein